MAGRLDSLLWPRAKPIAILNSAFEHVLFLDADNIPLSNPSSLFSTPEYQSTGALFWPDFWQTATANPIWSILRLSPGGREQESGQMVINKRRSWAALNLALFLAKEPAFQRFVNGDKEAFRLAFLATKTPFFMVGTPVAAAGANTDEGVFCGHTMVQHDLQGAPLFLHHNSLKHGANIVWELMKSVPAGKRYSVVPLPPGTIGGEPVSCLDIKGPDVITTSRPFAKFEQTFSRFQASADPAIKTVSRNEFVAVVQATRRRLLQANNTISQPPGADGLCPASNPNQCYSRNGGTSLCCSTKCSEAYANQDTAIDSVQFCDGDIGLPPDSTSTPTPTPTPTPTSVPAPSPTPPPGTTPTPTTVTAPAATLPGGGFDPSSPCGSRIGYTPCLSRDGSNAVCCLEAAGGCSKQYEDDAEASPSCAAPLGAVLTALLQLPDQPLPPLLLLPLHLLSFRSPFRRPLFQAAELTRRHATQRLKPIAVLGVVGAVSAV
eukprot:TRINITY_DN730_c0_g1_i1.p1 TRINITY_DN730_c0_g1~~TRINITY_DN730_c0_g1_i1.p1  ORF type:complete len:491 (-),score=36.88 TRINITY_DN730_c0_g1_i1:1037-2509(-)